MLSRVASSLLVTTTLLIVAARATLAASATVGDLRCEHRTNPLGVDEPHPRLSWKLVSNVPGQRQTAYQVVVTDDTGPLWDSGKIPSNASIEVPYGGPPLVSRQRVTWRVRVWDKDGAVVESGPATWEMGLLRPSDWKGSFIAMPVTLAIPRVATQKAAMRWIWYPEGDPAVLAPSGERTFRRVVTLPPDAKVKHGFLGFAADGRGEAFMNGKRLGRIPGIARLESFDVTSSLTPGDNTIEVRVSNGADAGGLLGQLHVQLENARPLVVSTDRSWQASREPNVWVPAREVARVGEGVFWRSVSADAMGLPLALPAPHLRTTFELPRKVRRARLYATALGLYELHLNGKRVGDAQLTPGWTDTRKRLLYQTYDVTDLVGSGKNALGAILGDGWYTGKVGYSGRHALGDYPLWLLANLVVELDDGSVSVIASGPDWRAHTGPIVSDDLQDGETYDARRELPGWSTAAFDASSWQEVVKRPQGGPALVADPGVPVRATQELKPVAITQPKPGRFVFDFGQNMPGWVRLKVRGSAGTTVELRFAEMLEPDGAIYRANLRGAAQIDRYTLRGAPDGETWQPRFTHHGFRYVEVTGYPGTPTIDALTGVVVHSDIPKVSTLKTSHPMVDKLLRNIDWGQRGNFVSVPTDCPQRDERLGWLGDAQIFARTAAQNRDVAAFFTKWLADVRDAQLAEGGFPDVAPRVPGMNDGAPAWGDAGVIVPWVMYEQYGDRRLLEQQYPAMVRFITFIERENPSLLWKNRRGSDYGDWLSIDAITDKEVLATAYFAGTTRLVARVAETLGRKADAARFSALADRIRAAWNRAYVDRDGRVKSETQTAYVLALAFDLLSEPLRVRASQHLVEDIRRRGTHLSTGFLGVGHLLPVLTDTGHVDVAYALLEQDTFPSWGYSIKHGATTIWERWDGWTKESGFQDPVMNSFNHYSLGSVGAWITSTVIGLAAAAPGWKQIRVAPRPGGTLTSASGTIDTPHGRVASTWTRQNHSLTVETTIPANTTAIVEIPGAATTSGGARVVRQDTTLTVFEAEAGSHRFTSTLP